MFKIINKENNARRGVINTVHGEVQTPCFMNVATCAAIKGALSSFDLETVNCRIMLCNTYHLHLRPGDDKIKILGGLHSFTKWRRPILTDSGAFRCFL